MKTYKLFVTVIRILEKSEEKQMAVMKEIAEYADVSIGSVVRYLRDPMLLKESTRKKIDNAIKTLQADPILPNVTVKEKKMMRIVVVMNDINNPFFANFFTTFQYCAKLRGMEASLFSPSDEKGRFRLELESLPDRSFENIVFCFLPEAEPAIEYADDFKNVINSVFIDASVLTDDFSNSTIDYSIGIEQAIDKAVELGHSKICYVGNALDDLNKNTKYGAFDRYMKRLKRSNKSLGATSIDIQKEFGDRLYNKWDWERGVMAAQLFLEQKMDATTIIAKNDLVALGMMREFQKNGIRIPEDISIIGCDNTVNGKMAFPSLATIDANIMKVCEETISSLEESIITYPSKALFKDFETKFVCRESLGEAPKEK